MTRITLMIRYICVIRVIRGFPAVVIAYTPVCMIK
jgi:hypothetical protein